MNMPTTGKELLHLALSVSLLLLYWCCWAHPGANGVTIDHPTLSTQDLFDLKFVQQNSWYQGQNAYQKDDAVWLNPDPRDAQSLRGSNLGRVIYKDPIQFISTTPTTNSPKRVASFNTSFSFQIITTAPYQECGSGMAFFISNSEKAPNNSDAGQLGLVDVNNKGAARFFAVEFDTHISPPYGDPSASHIGIDINSLRSINITDTKNETYPHYPELYLYSNYTFSTWIEYNSDAHVIQVWMTNSTSSERPSEPILKASYDLSLVFNEFMYVGFTATNAPLNDSMEGHDLYSWYFNSDDLIDPAAPSIPMTNPKSSNAVVLFIGIGLSVAVLFLVAVIVTCCLCSQKGRKRRASKTPMQHGPECDKSINSIGAMLHRYAYSELQSATNSFDEGNRIGSGGFSTVYKGTLPSGLILAVKKLKEHLRREDDFISEINIISGIRHRNLLQLQGWCYERGEALLVYKYMSNGSLESYLWGKKWGALKSDMRFKVLLGVASALEYLHEGLPDCVLHRDVKAANVMLNDQMEPLLGDFGLARLIRHDEAVPMTAIGTPGYVAPEVFFGGKGDEKVDVYSFGILALEIACGRPAISTSPANEEIRLVAWVWRLNKDNQLMSAIDESLEVESLSELEREKWRNVLVIGLMCCNVSADARPSMRQIIQALQGDNLVLPSMNKRQQHRSAVPGGNGCAGAGAGAAGTSFLHSHVEAPFGCSSSASSTATSLGSNYMMHTSGSSMSSAGSRLSAR